jgi:hypothetical protein
MLDHQAMDCWHALLAADMLALLAADMLDHQAMDCW